MSLSRKRTCREGYLMVEHKRNQKEYDRKYYAEHREEILRKHRKYNQEHRERINKAQRKYRKKYPEKRKEITRRHYQKHREEVLIKTRERAFKLRMKVLRALGGKCVYCGFSDFKALEIDHVEGGGNKEIRSLHRYAYLNHVLSEVKKGSRKYQLLCSNCNSIKRYEKMKIGKEGVKNNYE